MRTACLAFAAALMLAGCNRQRPSPEYTEASGSYTTLTAELGDDAYADERMTYIEGLLTRVPADSSDSAAAKDLLTTIAAERRRVDAEAAKHQRDLENALKVPDVPDSPNSPRIFEEPKGPAAAAAVDAGVGAMPDIAKGVTVEELRRVSGDCFNFSGPLKVRKGEKTEDAEIYERRNVGMCTVKYPQYPPNRILVFGEGMLVGTFDRADLKQEIVPPPPKVAPPEGQPPAPPQPGTAVPAPAPLAPPPAVPPFPTQTNPSNPGEQTGPPPAP